MLDTNVCSKARLSRDPRFDGKFFIAVKTTGIYCRTICPVRTPKEENVTYFPNAVLAADAGFRPCLRCRPDSAPGSPAWKGVGATLERAIKIIDEGYLQAHSLQQLATRLGVTDRYLRKLFRQHIGVSPKRYALYQQCLFAKKLLHQTPLPVSQIALASGFNSIRRFNDCFKNQLNLSPTQIREEKSAKTSVIRLTLAYRPPLNWPHLVQFLKRRMIPTMEWCDDNGYGRTFELNGTKGHFTLRHEPEAHQFQTDIEIDDIRALKAVVNNIRRLFDLDSDLTVIESDLSNALGTHFPLTSGIRLPGIWSLYEAGIRAILGQQISVTAAKNLVAQLVEELGEDVMKESQQLKHFPTPTAVSQSDLAFLKIPQSRKNTLIQFSHYYCNAASPDDTDEWNSIKGIGHWTIQYARLRGLSDPNILLVGDLGVKKAIKQSKANIDPTLASPWNSYLTFQLWSKLS
ncbi:helix-turn-helix domain-containing protein [Marinomonas mediterranea]|uniref:DNA-3-methyladenine glycosylase 2 family protein n=1 Tax=Marinomonas mediterranea TaxID=119864 RepID=UPI0023496C9C|nr:AlkA N-terminal domain-containing protein [Marinomonas mediterranea]WCN14110.1 helix-turn-helix domain-containing protein [Marinomonas mediterranea]